MILTENGAIVMVGQDKTAECYIWGTLCCHGNDFSTCYYIVPQGNSIFN